MIYKTQNYEMFTMYEPWRGVDWRLIDRLKRSIMQTNLLHERPIVVTPDMVVLDGRNRLRAAKELDYPIYYTIKVIDDTGTDT